MLQPRPDEFSVITYLAQFYHVFTRQSDSGLSSAGNSFRASSCEEEAGMTVHGLLRRRPGRPVSWGGRGRLQLTIQATPLEKDNPFRAESLERREESQKTYDADDEEGEQGERSRQPSRTAIYTAGQQDLILRRKRPTSLVGDWLSRNPTHPQEKQRKQEKRLCRHQAKEAGRKRVVAGRAGELGSKRKFGSGAETQPAPERPAEKKRRNEEGEEVRGDNRLDIVRQAPLNIAEKQKLLKTQFLQLRSPPCSRERLKLDIFQVKYKNLMTNTQLPRPKSCKEAFDKILHTRPKHSEKSIAPVGKNRNIIKKLNSISDKEIFIQFIAMSAIQKKKY